LKAQFSFSQYLVKYTHFLNLYSISHPPPKSKSGRFPALSAFFAPPEYAKGALPGFPRRKSRTQRAPHRKLALLCRDGA
jgi:hypothetical protein